MSSWTGWDFILRFLNITVIDIALSGDNAIVIGMAAAALPRQQRKWAIALGGGCAILLRILLTSVATLLMLIPFLAAVGGLVLIWVVYRLLQIDTGGDDKDEVRQASGLRQAIVLILTADFMMSLDNVIAVAGSAHGSLPLLIAGLLLSMPLLMTTGGFISLLIDKARWLVYVGAFAISFTAGRMVLEDKAVENHLHLSRIAGVAVALAAGAIIPAACVFVNHRMKRLGSHMEMPGT